MLREGRGAALRVTVTGDKPREGSQVRLVLSPADRDWLIRQLEATRC